MLDVEVDDLLECDAATSYELLLSRTIVGQAVMAIGASGLIGSKLCRQIMSISPRRLVFVEMTEYALYKIARDLTLNMRIPFCWQRSCKNDRMVALAIVIAKFCRLIVLEKSCQL